MENIFVEFLPPWVETGLQPAFYDKESGTVLQQTARMYARVNMLIRMFNKLSKNTKEEVERFEGVVNDEIEQFEHDVNETVDEYIEKFNQLHDYVHDYFDNLDVQEEINNKLDAMVEAGTLQEIIYTYIQTNAFLAFDTVADMKASTNLIDGSYAQTLGFHTINDGGGAIYKITNSGTANEMDVIAIDDLYANLVTGGIIKPEQVGAYGDGIHDDSTSIQKAFDSGDLVEFSPKTYLCFSLVTNNALNIKGNGATLKRPELDVAPYNKTVNEMKWIHTIDISEDCSISDLTFDNNCFTMWQVSDGFAQQQAAAISALNKNKKIKLNIDGCHFKNSAGDGLHIVENVIANVTNCTSEDCFRGGFVSTGYGSEINVDGWISRVLTTGVNDGIDIEVDSNSTVDANTYNVTISNVELDYDLDVYVPQYGNVTLNNVIMRAFDEANIHGFILKAQIDGRLLVNNCVLRSGVPETTQTYPQGGEISIINSKLIGNSTNPVVRVTQYQPDNIAKEGRLNISNCSIQGVSFLELVKLNATIVVDNCDVKCTGDCIVANGTTMPQVKHLIIQNSKFTYTGYFGTFLRTQYAVEGIANVYLYGNTYNAVTTDNGIKIEGNPSIYYDSTPFTSAYVLSLGTGAKPKFYGNERLIIVSSVSDLTFRGWVAGNDIAITIDTGKRYRYTSGTTWTEIS